MSSPFVDPPATSGIRWEDHLGHLLLIEPKGVEPEVPTAFGGKEAVHADITIIDAPNGPEVYADAFIFPSVLKAQTRGMVGKMVLGRLTQGVSKPGQKPPWRLQEADAEDKKQALEYVESRRNNHPLNDPPPF